MSQRGRPALVADGLWHPPAGCSSACLTLCLLLLRLAHPSCCSLRPLLLGHRSDAGHPLLPFLHLAGVTTYFGSELVILHEPLICKGKAKTTVPGWTWTFTFRACGLQRLPLDYLTDLISKLTWCLVTKSCDKVENSCLAPQSGVEPAGSRASVADTINFTIPSLTNNTM